MNLSKQLSGNFEKKCLLLMGPGGCMACLGPHGEVMERESVCVKECGPGVLPLLELSVGCLGFCGFTLYW